VTPLSPGIATIGVYGFDASSFFDALAGAGVGSVLDVRQRRGVRGHEYAWANSQRLQAALAEAGIGYRHLKGLAPTTAMRQLQYREDDRRGEGKRSRTKIAAEFARRYTEEVLDRADLSPIVEATAETLPALLCVERDPEACHRSLIAARLHRDWGLEAVHLRPGHQAASSKR
jgi:uncharacterized protein (DUF488 family)